MDIIARYFSDFTEKQNAQFAALEELYKEWNQKINIISRKDIEGLYEKHVLHSLAIAAAFNFSSGLDVVDIGTGGGFPGLPLAIFFPEVRFHLVDSIGKKLKVIQGVKEAIGLENITTEHIRAEEIKNKKFDFAVSRAVAPLKDLWSWSKPLLKRPQFTIQTSDANNRVAGLICLKGGNLKQEILESNLKPRILKISEIFGEEYFREKYILYAPLS